MGYRSERHEHERKSESQEPRRPQRGGFKYTALSFIVMLAMLALIKAMHPAMEITGLVTMVAGAGLACAILVMLGRRK